MHPFIDLTFLDVQCVFRMKAETENDDFEQLERMRVVDFSASVL